MIRSSLMSSLSVFAFAAPALADTLVVTSAADRGEGTLRAALEAAAQSETSTVIALQTGDIQIETPLIYAGRAPLRILGADQTIASSKNVTLLTVAQGADLSISDLTFAGPGGYSINDQASGTPGKGIFVDIRDDQTGTAALRLSVVTVRDMAGHGIHVSDCDLADDCGGGGGGAGDGSQASIAIDLRDVRVSNVGQGSFDADGVRVDERGAGDIVANITGSVFTGVGADGVELDEGQGGSVIAQVVSTRFEANGSYCDPAILEAFLPSPDEMEFDEGERAEADIPGPASGSPDNACIEREVDLYDDGTVEAYEFGIDVDDGFDIDEAGPGGIEARLIETVITGNLDEGADFDEEDAGGIVLSVIGGSYGRNSDDGIKLSEEDAGDVTADLLRVKAVANGGKGLVFEEEDGGDIVINAVGVMTADNDDSDDTGLEAEQSDAGQGSLSVVASDFADGIDTDGVDLR